MSSIVDLIGQKWSELRAFEYKKKPAVFDRLHSSISKDTSISTKLGQNIYMTNRSRKISIMGPIEKEQPELFALESGKITTFNFVLTLASTNINHPTRVAQW